MDSKSLIRASKFISLVLRHKPETAGLTLSESGWCSVTDLLKGCNSQGVLISREALEQIVSDNDKKRFQFSEDGRQIRAVQGHSVDVDLKYEPSLPPPVLYHGTATRFLDSIKKQGLVKGSRQHVHLSSDTDTARKVGQRHGIPLIIPVDTPAMHTDGIEFYHAPNGVWLVDSVPLRYLQFNLLLW